MALHDTTVDTGGELVEGLGYRDFTLSFPTQNIDFVNSPPVSVLGLPHLAHFSAARPVTSRWHGGSILRFSPSECRYLAEISGFTRLRLGRC
jgi:hypothetical protein